MPSFRLTSMLFALLLASCALRSGWHWERPDASDTDYETDLRFCKSTTDQALDGHVTYESVRRVQACMAGRGWKKAAD